MGLILLLLDINTYEFMNYYFLETSKGKSKPQAKPSEIIDLVDKPHNARCLNTSCEGNSEVCFPAADFCLSYYRVKKSKTHKEEVCDACYKKAVSDFDKLCSTLSSGDLLLEVSRLFFKNLRLCHLSNNIPVRIVVGFLKLFL